MYHSTNVPVTEKCSLFLTFFDNHVLTVGLHVTLTHVYNAYTVDIVEIKCKYQKVEVNGHHI